MPLVVNDTLTEAGFASNDTAVAKYIDIFKKQVGGVTRTLKPVAGRSVEFFKLNNDKGAKRKLEQAEEAIKILAAGYDGFPTNISVYAHNVAGLLLPSLGYMTRKGTTIKFDIFIGPSPDISRPLQAGTQAEARGGFTGLAKGSRLIMDQVWDYYKPTFTVNQDNKKCLALVLHEFGHAIHQWKNPDHYFCFGDQHMEVAMGAKNAKGIRQDGVGWDSRETTPLKTSHLPYWALAKKKVSSWAGCMGLNEIVPEVFCGIIMGVPFSQAVLTAYAELGGPEVPDACIHVRKGKEWPYSELP